MNNTDQGSGVNTLLIVVLIIIVVGALVWFFTRQQAPANNGRSLDVNVQLPGGGDNQPQQ